MSEPTTYGVVVARFQVPWLHIGHRHLLNEVSSRHSKMIVVLGCQRAWLPTERNPLDFVTRSAMVREKYPDAIVMAARDCRSDRLWSAKLDKMVRAITGNDQVVLYGSRESFLTRYSGELPTVEVPAIETVSGTEVRRQTGGVPDCEAARRGAIYAANVRPAGLFQAVDIAIYNAERDAFLLGRRDEDSGFLRFPGGFVEGDDASLEAAAQREAAEETSQTEISKVRYVCSRIVDDWRYRRTNDRIMTALFYAEYVFGSARPSDDLDGTVWVSVDDLTRDATILTEEHRPLAKAALEFLQVRKLEGTLRVLARGDEAEDK